MGGNGGAKSGLFANAGAGQGLEGMYSGNAANVYGALEPQLAAEAAHPEGYSPAQMAAQTTGAEQTAGGGAAGATGGALLRAARTGNKGAGQAAISQASRNASQNLSQTNAGIQTASANLAAKRQGQAQAGLGNLYGENVGAGINALNSSTNAFHDASQIKPFWEQLLLQGMQSAGQAASGNLGRNG
jgi:hypothetical protein